MGPKELKILLLLKENPSGLYGIEIVTLSNGLIKRGTVYVTLDRLSAKGFIQIDLSQPMKMARPSYTITSKGHEKLNSFLKDFNLKHIKGNRNGKHM